MPNSLPLHPYESVAYAEGVKAFQNGKRIIDNPYRHREVDRPLFQLWLAGYRHAKKMEGF